MWAQQKLLRTTSPIGLFMPGQTIPFRFRRRDFVHLLILLKGTDLFMVLPGQCQNITNKPKATPFGLLDVFRFWTFCLNPLDVTTNWFESLSTLLPLYPEWHLELNICVCCTPPYFKTAASFPQIHWSSHTKLIISKVLCLYLTPPRDPSIPS